MTRLTMVSRTFKSVSKNLTTFTSTQRCPERSNGKVESTRNADFTATSGVDNLRQNLLAEEISESGYEKKHYESAWKKWCGWCFEREMSPTRSNINYVLNF